MPLPPYLSSAASSRAHHALLVKLDGATSSSAEDAAVLAEVERCRGVLASGPSSSRIVHTLIILLHCATVTRTPLDLEFALVPALELAEGGRSMRERRMGYLYLAEQLPPGHELHLMLINTIRKDLASTSEAHVLAALHAISHLPGPDLAPAVVPLLSSRRLLEHDVPVVRQRTIQAISALANGELTPLSLREIARRIRREDDDSVLAALLRLFAQSLDSGARESDPDRRWRQFESVFSVASRKMDADSPLVIAAIRALVAIVRTLPKQIDPESAPTDKFVIDTTQRIRDLLAEAVDLHTAPGISQWARACLLETSTLATALYEVDGQLGEGVETLLDHLRRCLVPPPDKGKGKASSPPSRFNKQAADTPNNHILALRCFGVLPAAAWQNGLTEAHMAALMGGVDSTDQTVRKATLRLLCKVDRNLPSLTLESHLEAVRTSRGLPLPPNVNPISSQKHAIVEGRIEAACRALEAVDVLSEGLDDAARGRELGDGVAKISAALRAGEPDTGVWLKGIQAIISDLQSSPVVFRAAVIETLSRHLADDPTDTTTAVLVTTVAAEYPVAEPMPTIDALVGALPVSPPSVQELIVLALVPLLARLPTTERSTASARVAQILKTIQDKAIKHMAKRCQEVLVIVEDDLVDTVIARSKSRALNDILDALLATYAEACKPSPTVSGASSPRKKSHGYGNSSLRYDAYDTPQGPVGRRSFGADSRSGSGSPGRSPQSPDSSRVRSPLSRAAELTQSTWAMGRSTLIDPEDLPMDDLAVRHGVSTPQDRTPRVSTSERA